MHYIGISPKSIIHAVHARNSIDLQFKFLKRLIVSCLDFKASTKVTMLVVKYKCMRSIQSCSISSFLSLAVAISFSPFRKDLPANK